MWDLKRLFRITRATQPVKQISAVRGRRCHGCRERIAVFRCIDAELCDPCFESYRQSGHVSRAKNIEVPPNPFDELQRLREQLHKAEDDYHALELVYHRLEQERDQKAAVVTCAVNHHPSNEQMEAANYERLKERAIREMEFQEKHHPDAGRHVW